MRAPPRKGKGKAGKAGSGPTTGAAGVGTPDNDGGHFTAAAAGSTRAKAKPSRAKRSHHSTPAPLNIKQGAQTGPPLSPTTVSATSPQAMAQLHRLQCMQSQLLIQQQELQASVEEKPPPSYVAPPPAFIHAIAARGPPPGLYDGTTVERYIQHPTYQQQFNRAVAYAQSMDITAGPPPSYEEHNVLQS